MDKEKTKAPASSAETTDPSVEAALKALEDEKRLEEGDDEGGGDELPKSAMPKYIKDPKSLTISRSTISDQKIDVQNLFGSKPSFQVVCSQSGYMARMSSLVYKDVFNMTNSNLSNYETKKEIYRTIYSKIVGFSAQDWHPTFEEWLKATSFEDVDTLYYGIYCSTFQEKSTVSYDCPVCDQNNVIDIDNSQLVRVDDKDEMLSLTKRISSEANTQEKINDFSLIADKESNYTYIELPDTKIVIYLKLPSLWDALELIRTFSDEELALKSITTINIALMTKQLLLPKTGPDKKPIDPPTYSEVQSKKDIFGIFDILSVNDYAALNAAASKILEDKHITYVIKDQTCPNCGAKIGDIPMDMEKLLFFQIRERRL